MSYLDETKPEVKEGELLCGGCWKVKNRSEAKNWLTITFRHLETQHLCPECRMKHAKEFGEIQGAGL